MGIVVEFERFKDVTGWSIWEIRNYIHAKGWKGFILHWKEGDDVVIERTSE